MDGKSFFLNSNEGKLFAIYFTPTNNNHPNSNVIIVPPFAEEMNKSRKAISEFSRICTTMNVGVLMIDFIGTGESEGDFKDARWWIWKKNIFFAYQWLKQRGAGSISCIGIRMGAILLLDAINTNTFELDKLLFWQPVVSGSVYLKQFLRLNLAADLMVDGSSNVTVQSFRDILSNGGSVEVAGYELSSELYQELNNLSLSNISPTLCAQLIWFEVVANELQEVGPTKRQIVDKWKSVDHVDASIIAIRDEPFWATQEIVIPDNLIKKTASIFA